MRKINLLFISLSILFFISGKAFSQALQDPFDPNFLAGKSNGEIIRAMITYWDNYYDVNFYSQGIIPGSGTGYNPYQRWKWLTENRLDENGEIPHLARWQAFKEIQATMDGFPQSWTSFGPTNISGRILSYAFDPNNSQILWVGSASGGLWKTTNGGNTWKPMTDHIPSLAVSSVAINPKNSQSMLMGTGEGYRNIDAVHGLGVLKSTDGGATWDTTSFAYEKSLSVSTFGMVWDPVNTNNVYLAATNGIWKSGDAGETWTQKKTGRATAIVIDKNAPSTLYAAIESSGIYKSIDNGQKWTAITIGLPAATSIGFTSLAICDAFPNVLYTGIANKSTNGLEGFYKTSNGGNNWVKLANAPNFYSTQGWYDNVTAVSPADTTLIFAGGVNLYRTTDGGTNWPTVGGGVVHPDQHSFAFDPSNSQTVYAFTDGGVFKSTDSGVNWVGKNAGLVTFQFYAIASALTNTDLVSGGTQDQGTNILNAGDGNTQWNRWIGADGMVTNIDYTNNDIMYGEKQKGNHQKTIDGGNPTFSINTGIPRDSKGYRGPWVTPVVMDPVNPQVLYTISLNSIYKTTSGGQKISGSNGWTNKWGFPAVGTGSTNPIAIDMVDNNIVYVFVSSTKSVLRSSDAGTSWAPTETSPGSKTSDLEADPDTKGALYATQSTYTRGQQIWTSADSGNTWVNISNNFPPTPAQSIAITKASDTNVKQIYVGTDLGVFMTFDSDYYWLEFNGELPYVVIDDIHFHPVDKTVRVGTHGRGYWNTKALEFSDNNIVLSNLVITTNEFYGTKGSITATDVAIESPDNTIFAAEQGITLDTGFSVKLGSGFSAYVFQAIQ